ncbi:GNAT family N-acetyltransferase [Streptomyces sp. NPDC056144]|uniref:GNAT family N-acetyltransferase n=1 Tax=unclassified Streptomyces TaxID=2593676 RepID=UPI0035E29D7B
MTPGAAAAAAGLRAEEPSWEDAPDEETAEDLAVHRFASLAEVPEDVWAALSEADSLYVSRPWSEALTRSNPALPVAFWAVAGPDGGWLAGAPVHLFDAAPPSPTYSPWSLHPGLVEDADAVRALPHALVGTRNGQGNGLLWAPGAAGTELRAAAVTALAAGIRAALPGHAVVWTYTPPALAHRLAEALPGARVLFADTTAELRVPEARAENEEPDFLGSVRASQRRRLRADLAAIAAAGGPVEPELDPEAVAGLSEELAPLLGQVMARHGHTPDVPALARYLRACAAPDLRPAAFVVREEGRAIAFSLCVSHGDEMSVRVCGLDHEAVEARGAMDYAQVSVHGPVALAARTGVRRIDLGVGTLDAKLMRGAHPRALATVVSLPSDGGHALLPGLELARLPLLVEQSRVLAARRPEGWSDLED